MMLPFVNILPTSPAGIGSAKPFGGEPLSNGTGDGQTFESLMNLFGMAEPALSAFPINSEANIQSKSLTDGSTSLDEAIASMLAGSIQSPVANTGLEQTVKIVNAELAGDASFRAVTPESILQPVEPNLQLDQKLSLPIAQPWTMTLAQHRPIDLKPGKYQVLKQDLNNGKLTLDLKSTDNAEPIKVTIPIELLHQESHDAITPAVKQSAGVQTTPTRVTLVSPNKTELESLLGKVNVREMEVTVEPTSAVYQAADEPMKVQIVAEQAGQNLLFAGKLNRAQLKAQTSTKKTVSAVATPATNENPTPVAANGLTVDSVSLPRRRVVRPVAFESEGQAKTQDSELIAKLLIPSSQDGAIKQDGLDQFTLKSTNVLDQTTQQARMEIPRVKITMPQEMPQIKADGQTIMLKIEPEHLGPAKLELSVRGESMSARVTVETVHAKAAVESSLDQLNDQLARAGVKVNYIEVNVRGGGADSQFFHRQSEWFRSQQPRVARIADDLLAEASKIVPAAMPVSYLGAGSVNLYA
ncbi:MAG: flagellar hook-length control protein FliK [bacterium]|nr:flagellar hook-length control protein FliK [bacterium]